VTIVAVIMGPTIMLTLAKDYLRKHAR